MAEIPSRLVSDAERSLDLERGHALLGFRHEIDCEEPFGERKVGIAKDRNRGYEN